MRGEKGGEEIKFSGGGIGQGGKKFLEREKFFPDRGCSKSLRGRATPQRGELHPPSPPLHMYDCVPSIKVSLYVL